MIDYFDISVDGEDFPPMGKALTTEQPGGLITESFTQDTIKAGTNAPQFQAKIESRAKRIRFFGSPASLLQCHNGMGSNDFQGLVRATVPLLFATKKMNVPPVVAAALKTGQYNVHEAHVAEHYKMPHDLIGVLCDQIRRYAPASLCATSIKRGVGVRCWPESRDREFIIYDKYHYFHDGMRKHRLKLLGSMPIDFPRFGMCWDFDAMLDEYLAHSVRIEGRFKRCLNNKTNPLNKGYMWTPTSARELHVQHVAAIRLDTLPLLAKEEELLRDPRLKAEDRRIVALWLAGREMSQFFDSTATYSRWKKLMKENLNIDLTCAPIPSPAFDWKATE